MKLSKNNLKELVKYCGGDEELVKHWICEVENQEVNTIEELENYPFKKHYVYLITKKEAPNLYDFIKGSYYERYQTIDLEDILDMFYEAEVDNEDEISKELIKLKFGSMEYDW
ncbi:MAG: hypothetical protein ACRCX8_06765 [Sarcina sp.]